MLRAAEMTVSELNLAVDEAIRRDPRLQDVTVRGEVSGFKHHLASGHWYFALKDAEAAVNCVMFRQNNLRSLLKPKDGDSVVVTGYVKVYARSGACQLYVTGRRSAGTGDLHQRFGYPNSANDIPELIDYLQVLKEEGFFNAKNPMVLSMEVLPTADEDEEIVLANTKRCLNRAWAMLED